MNFQRISGESKIRPYNKKASTAFNQGDVMFVDSNGFLDKAGATTTGNDIVGISMETVASTDSDYAGTRAVAVDVCDKGGDDDRFLATVGTGNAAQTTVGEAHDLKSDGTVDVSASTTKVVKVERFRSATQVEVAFLNTGDLA
jgi:hypothetical protein